MHENSNDTKTSQMTICTRVDTKTEFGLICISSVPSNPHDWWVHLEFQNGSVNKAGSNTSKYRLYRHIYGSLTPQSSEVHPTASRHNLAQLDMHKCMSSINDNQILINTAPSVLCQVKVFAILWRQAI